MREAWAAFLSCDARDMCRLGPAFGRVALTWLAVLFRLATLWLGLEADIGFWAARAKSDFCLGFGTVLSQSERVAYESFRSEAEAVQAAWRDDRLDDEHARAEVRGIVAAIARWTSERELRKALFLRHGWNQMIVNLSDFVDSEYQPCPPFVLFWGRQTGVLDQEERYDEALFFCTYLLFVY
ncbi:MAG TPA: hypothetical protein VEK15_06655 [Vicinamibacteria bacterium]|nr:hypothetical protein [Vicinamibacteria bacterium]